MKTKVAVICGGYSSEKKISMLSVETVLQNLAKDKYDPVKVVIDSSGWWCETGSGRTELNRDSFTYNNGAGTFDFAFIMIHGTPGEDGKLQAYFDMLNIPYSTCNHLMSSITFNKWACNGLLQHLGYTCAPSILIRRNERPDIERIASELGFPIFVKPADGGSSYGVTKVRDKAGIEEAVLKAKSEGTDALTEAFIKGTEVTCGAYHNGENMVVLPITEIVSKNEFFDFEAKYNGASEEITPARISQELTDKIQDIVFRVCTQLGLTGIVRIDFIIQDDTPFLIEINTVPGFSAASIVPQQIRAAGLTVEYVLDQVVQGQLALHKI